MEVLVGIVNMIRFVEQTNNLSVMIAFKGKYNLVTTIWSLIKKSLVLEMTQSCTEILVAWILLGSFLNHTYVARAGGI